MKSNSVDTRLKARLSRLFSAFRQGAGVPPWLVTDTTASMFINQMDKWLHLLPPIGFNKSLDLLQQNLCFEQIPPERFIEESRRWADDSQVQDALLAADKLIRLLIGLWRQGKLAQVGTVLRTLPIVGALFWSAEASKIAPEVAEILGCCEVTPAKVFDSYRMAVESEDEDTLLKLEQLVDGDRTFNPWSSEFLDVAVKVNLPERPAPLPVTALAPSVLLRILEMEDENDNG